MKSAAAIAAGSALLAWPAVVNVYPLVFSDTAGLADMGLEPNMGWDKPWVYGPLILLLHWSISLWGVVAGQVLVTSAVLWRVGRMVGPGGTAAHLALCAVLAVGSALPWFASFVMPDIFAPLTVLCLTLLAWGGLGRVGLVCGVVLAAVAIASHLAHLIVAAGCLVAIAAACPRRLPVCAAPLALALAWIAASNLIGNGVLGISPYGSVFALARLQADGPGADYIKSVCPAANYRVCAWADRLPMDSDAFLWAPDSPVWDKDFGPILFAPEASRIVPAVIRFEPVEVARHAAFNTLRQLIMVRIDDTFGPQYLDSTVGKLLRTYFPAAELQRLLTARQIGGTLLPLAAPLGGLRLVLLALGAIGSLLIVPMAWRSNRAMAGFALAVLLGILANAFATGALSGPHDRYGARIAWLVLLPPAFAVLNAWQRRRVRSRSKETAW